MKNATRRLAAALTLTLAGCATGTFVDELASSSPTEAGGEDGTGAVLPSPSSSADAADGSAAATEGGDVTAGGSCAAAATCDAPVDLGSVAGDVGAESESRQGVGSAWFELLVREDSTSSTPIRLRAELTSPPGTNYDVVLYTNPYSSTSSECSNVRASSTTDGAVDVASLELKDYGGIDDEQVVTIEVRHVSGPCAPSAKWTLSLVGNAL